MRLKPETMLAVALAVLFTAAWAWRDWSALAAFRLPDNDDMMRLAQIRDWIDGQAFADLTQHRLGPPGGASMHWSRLADMGPAAIILALTPLIGRTGAEQAMLVLYPGALFVIALLLTTRITARLAPDAQVIGAVVAALAFPAASLFVPGRIDHHGIQIVLTLWFADRLVAPASWRSGALMGLATALSLAVGLETLPLLLFGMAAIFLRYAIDGERTRPRAFGLTLAATTGLAMLLVRPRIWPSEWCDGFTPASTSATFAAAGFFAAIGLLPLRDWRLRLGIGAAIGLALLPLVLATSSVCLTGPYGAMDPLLQHLWMSRVGEALGLLGQDSPGVAVSYGAFGLVGLAASVLILRLGSWRAPEWQGFAILFILGVLLTLVQIRATYVVSMLAAVPVAALIHRVRQTSTSPLARVGIWVLGAGLTWNLIGLAIDQGLAPRVVEAKLRNAACTGPQQVQALAALPPGRVAAPLDSAAYILGGTPHSAIAAPYHRNNPGNLALYRLYLGSPEAARSIAQAWQVDYLILCRDSFGELGTMADDPRRLIARLRAGTPPAWLRRIPTSADGPLVFRVQP